MINVFVHFATRKASQDLNVVLRMLSQATSEHQILDLSLFVLTLLKLPRTAKKLDPSVALVTHPLGPETAVMQEVIKDLQICRNLPVGRSFHFLGKFFFFL